jgi:hypothetical protein
MLRSIDSEFLVNARQRRLGGMGSGQRRLFPDLSLPSSLLFDGFGHHLLVEREMGRAACAAPIYKLTEHIGQYGAFRPLPVL